MVEGKGHYEELLFRRQRRPFVSFTIMLHDGRRFDIAKPRMFATNGSIVLVLPPDSLSETFRITDIREVVPGIVERPTMPSEFFYG